MIQDSRSKKTYRCGKEGRKVCGKVLDKKKLVGGKAVEAWLSTPVVSYPQSFTHRFPPSQQISMNKSTGPTTNTTLYIKYL